ncbi:ankyrin repeat-containing domain protein [Xylaria cubensis]|nr:ankyrin repeat-containing domain protein [Xylaria cubensis]
MSQLTTQDEWDVFKDQISMLYIKENRQLEGCEGVIEVMQKRHNFNATKAQYEYRLKKWGLRKYAKGVPDKDWQIMLYKFESRRSKTGKEPQVCRFGQPINPGVIKNRGFMKYTERNALEQGPSPQTPPGFSINTPSPSVNPPSPTTRPFPIGNDAFTSGRDLPSDNLFGISDSMDVDYLIPHEGDLPVSAIHHSPGEEINTNHEFSSDIIFADINDINMQLGFVRSPEEGTILQNVSPISESVELSAVTGMPSCLETYHSFAPGLLDFAFSASYWENLPWSLFRRAIEKSNFLHSAATGSSDSFGSLEIDNGHQLILGERLPELLLDGVSSQRLTVIFESLIPKRLDGELFKNVQQFLDTSSSLHISQIIELFMALVSNNIITRKAVRRFLDLIMKYNPVDLLRELFEINTPTVQAVLTRILEVVAENGEDSALTFLLDAGIDQGNLAGARGGRLLQLATDSNKTEVAKILLQLGANANPKLIHDFAYPQFNSPPLHHAVKQGNPELVSCLLKSGANVDCCDEFGETALSHAISLSGFECVELLLCEGAMVDTCKVSDGRELYWSGNNAMLDAVDYAYLNGPREIYDLLLPYSQNARERITIHGVLRAAKEGYETLQTYLDSRTGVAQKSRKAVLEEALVLELYNSGSGEIIRTLLDFGVDPDVPTYDTTDGDHPLRSAMSKGISTFKYLVAAGANFKDQSIVNNAAYTDENLPILEFMIHNGLSLDLFGVKALTSAASWKNLRAVKLLVEYGVNVNEHDSGGEYPIQTATKWSSIKIVKYLLNHGADPNVPPCRKDGNTALHYAVNDKNLTMVQLLMKFGARITPPDPRAKTTLLETLCDRISKDSKPMLRKERQLFEFLLDKGAYINHLRPENRPDWWSPVLPVLIKKSADPELIRRVLNTDIDVNEAGTTGYTAIQAAAAVGNLELVKELHSRGAGINAPAVYSFGRTALQAACSKEEINMELITFLLDNGADVNARPGVKYGLTALQGAAIKGHIGLASLLLERGANVNAPPAIVDGRTALEGAAEHGRLDMVQFLLNIEAKDEEGGYDGAIQLAEENGHWAVTDLLSHHKASQAHVAGQTPLQRSPSPMMSEASSSSTSFEI